MKRTLIISFALASTLTVAQDPILNSQVRMSVDNLSNSGNETSAVASADGMEILGGFNDYRTDGTIKASFGVSSDGGQTWNHVMVRPPAANQTTVEGDPMSGYDPRTNTLFAGAIAFGGNGGVYLAKKTPGQNTFGASVMCRVSSGADKEWLAIGPRPGLPNTTRLYIAYNEGVIRSDDLGSTWTAPTSLGSGIGFLPRVGPNGEVYVTYWDFNFGIKFRRSLDGGVTWSAATQPATRLATWGVQNYGIPGTFRNPPIHTMAVSPTTGDIVIMYFDQTNIVSGQRNLDLYMTRSTNQGTTFSAPVRLPFRPLTQISDMIYPWIEFTKDGRLHLMTMDTSLNPGQTDGVQHGLWNQVYYYSDDEGGTWSQTMRLTPASWDSFNDGIGGVFLGDYQGMAISDRSVFPVYPDTHTNQAEVYTNKIYNPIERPTSFSMFRGVLISGGLSSLFLRDSSSVIAKSGVTANASEPPIQLQASTSGILNNSPSSMKAYVSAFVSSVNIQQQVSFRNINTNQWDVVDTRVASLTEANIVVNVPNPVNYITPGSGTVSWRVTFKPTGPVNNSGWTANVNQDILYIVP